MNRKDYLVTIVVAVYNIEKYLDNCITSILKQSYASFNVLFVDDGSTDNSSKIIKKYNDTRFNYIYQYNRGLSAARNTGIDNTVTKYICFVDGDDYLEPDYIKTMIECIDNSDFAVCNFYVVDQSTKNKNTPLTIRNNQEISVKNYWKLFYKYLASSWGVVAWNKMYSMNLFQENRYKEGVIHEDEEIIHRLLSKSNRIMVVTKPLYNYISRSESITSNLNFKTEMDRNEALLNRCEYFNQNKMFEFMAFTLLMVRNSLAQLKSHGYVETVLNETINKYFLLLRYLKKNRPFLYLYYCTRYKTNNI